MLYAVVKMSKQCAGTHTGEYVHLYVKVIKIVKLYI